jgi:hypothetical protein
MSCNYCWPGNCCGGPNCQSKPPLPPRADVIRALGRMAASTRELGHYSACRLDAGWIEAAVEMLCNDAHKATPR